MESELRWYLNVIEFLSPSNVSVRPLPEAKYVTGVTVPRLSVSLKWQ